MVALGTVPVLIEDILAGRSPVEVGFVVVRRVAVPVADIAPETSLGGRYPHLAPEWNESNLCSPYEIADGSNTKVSWRCALGHQWETFHENTTKKLPRPNADDRLIGRYAPRCLT
jgi:hypothetical protein